LEKEQLGSWSEVVNALKPFFAPSVTPRSNKLERLPIEIFLD
jgi:hypothetical protein